MGMEPIQWDVEQLETSESPCATRVFGLFLSKFWFQINQIIDLFEKNRSDKCLENQESPPSSIGQISQVCGDCIRRSAALRLCTDYLRENSNRETEATSASRFVNFILSLFANVKRRTHVFNSTSANAISFGKSS